MEAEVLPCGRGGRGGGRGNYKSLGGVRIVRRRGCEGADSAAAAAAAVRNNPTVSDNNPERRRRGGKKRRGGFPRPIRNSGFDCCRKQGAWCLKQLQKEKNCINKGGRNATSKNDSTVS